MENKRKGKYSSLVGCSLMLSIVYMSLTSWSIAVNELSETFHLSTPLIQAGSAMLVAGYAIGGYIEGKWIAKWGWKKVFTGVIIAFVVASALIPLMTNYYIILVLRFIQGWGCMVSLTSAVVSSWFPSKERGMALGILLGSIGLGSALGGWVGGLLTPVIGWKMTFWIITALAVLGALIFYAMVKEAPPLEEEQEVVQSKENTEPQKSVFKEPALWLLGLSTVCCFFGCYGMYAYLSEYLFTLHYTAGQVGTIVFVNGFIAVFSTPIGGWVSDKMIDSKGTLRARTWTNTWVALFVGLLGFVLMPHLAPLGMGMALLVSLIAGWGIPATNGPGFSLPADLLGSAASGTGVGMVLLIAGIGGIVSPIFVPWLAHMTNWTVGWYVTAASCLIGMIINMVLGKMGKNNS